MPVLRAPKIGRGVDLNTPNALGTVRQVMQYSAANTLSFNWVDYPDLTNRPVLGSAASQNVSYFLQTANNLSDIPNVTTAKANLQLSAVATSGSYSDLSGKPDLSVYALLSGATFTGNISALNLSGTNTGNQTTSNSDGTVTVTNGTTNPVVSLALGHANTWAALQTFGSGLAGTSASLTGSGPQLTIGSASSIAGSIAFKNASNSNTLTLQSGVTASALTFTLPTADGSSGQFLKTNGSGTLSFGSITSANVTTALGYTPIDAALEGANNGVATLDGTGKLTTSQIPSSLVGGLVPQGNWNASTNSPSLTSSVGTAGYLYIVSVAGTTNLDGNATWNVGDSVYFANGTWHKLDGSNGTVYSVSVVSANGITGSVANASTAPAITLTLGAITPSSVAATGNVTGANLSGTNTGDQTITLTGDITGSGTGSFATTLATVNTNVGTYNCFTVNGKGLITAASFNSSRTSCRVATTSNLTVTYSNGSSGVGATLTNAGTQAALSLDGVSLAVNDRVLVWNQSTQAQNGLYKVTTVGSGSVNWVLTRVTDFDNSTAGQIAQGAIVGISEGSAQAGSIFVQTAAGPFTIGTTAITFAQNQAGNVVGGYASSVSNSDGTLTISPTQGAVVASLNLAHANTWSAAQTISVNGAASTPALLFSGTPATGSSTTSYPLVYISPSGATNPSFNTSGTMLAVNAASGFTGLLFGLYLNGTAQLTVSNAGAITCGAVTAGSNVQTGAASRFQYNGRSLISSPADGKILLQNNAATAFTILQFGGTTTSFCGINISGTTMGFTLADGTGNATINAGTWNGATIGVGYGGTGLTSGTSGGIPYFSATSTIASSAALAANGVVIGGGAGVAPSSTGVTIDSNNALYGHYGKINAQSGTTYTLASTDAGKIVELSNASAITLTIPNSLSAGFWCRVVQTGAGQVTVSAAAGATLRNYDNYTKTAGQWAELDFYVTSNSGGSSAVYVMQGRGA